MTDDAFISQFIGKAAPFTAGENVNVLSGATFTSKAVIEALNSLFAAEEAAEELSASAMGFESTVTVKITKDANGAIATLVVDASDETEGLGTRCMTDDAFISQFIGKKGPFESIDMVSGATYTSTAVMNALNSLFPAE